MSQVLIDAAADGERLLELVGDAGLTTVITTHQHWDHHRALADVGTCTLKVIRVTGHTPGSICLLYDDGSGSPHLFTGDCLFPGGVSNTQGDAARFSQLIDDVSTKLFDTLADETWFHPGHGDDGPDLGTWRPHLAEWRARGW